MPRMPVAHHHSSRPAPHRPQQPRLLLSRPVEDCYGYPALSGVRNLGLDDPSAVVQIYIAISATEASRRVERLQRAEPGPSSGGVPAELFVGPNGRRLRSAWHVVASMHPINQ